MSRSRLRAIVAQGCQTWGDIVAGYRRRAWVNEFALSQLRTRKLDVASVGEAIHDTQGAEPLVRAALLHMLWTRELLADLSKVLSSTSILRARSSS
jgi:hypothetical protein